MDTSSLAKSTVTSPTSSPGLYNPSPPPTRDFSQLSSGTPVGSPYLHPLQVHKVRETHKASVEQDFITGRKLINQYEIIEEIGRGVHGKVKLARSLENSEYVAIKIIQRFSKKRRLGRVTVEPEAKTKREIAILKKIRHPNVVGLLEVIDDPELKKIYMVLEHVELGEIVWRKKGTPQICSYERRRIERELRGEKDTGDDEKFWRMLERRRQRKDAQRTKNTPAGDYWSLEHGDDEDDFAMTPLSRISTHESMFMPRSHNSHTSLVRSNPGSTSHSRATSRAPSRASSSARPYQTEFDIGPIDSDNEDETPGPLPSLPSTHSSAAGLQSLAQGSNPDDAFSRGRAPSMADSIISHMSSVDDITQHDSFEDDFSYVPCFTVNQARSTFRDTVLGLEYLHYEGIVHRDIKPPNLLWTRDHRVKISDFGVSYFGRPIRDGEAEENVSEADAQDFDDDLELAKTVGTPAFFAPELCYTDLDVVQPRVTEQIDVWSLGVTLYCLIFARIPFMAEDEYQLFRAIAQQDVHIPRRRLKPVDPCNRLPGEASPPEGTYRAENDLVMEDVDDELHDLLRRMLTKDPVERMKLREVKRHPWVIKDIKNVIGWLDDTDPSRKTEGRRIEVDDKELERAVVPITFLERARSAVKKAVGKVIGRSDTSGSRRRAVSNATSPAGEIIQPTPITPMKNPRRASLRGDESYLGVGKELPPLPGDHPLAQSVTASPEQPLLGEDPFANQFLQEGMPDIPTPQALPPPEALSPRPPPPERIISNTASIQTVVPRDNTHSPLSEISIPEEANTPIQRRVDPFPVFTDHNGQIIRDSGRSLKNTRSMELRKDESETKAIRAKSAERALFISTNKHGDASVAVSKATAPGNFDHGKPPLRHQHTASLESVPTSTIREHPHYFRPSMLATTQQSMSSPNVNNPSLYAASMLDDRPATANRTPEGKTPAPRVYATSTAESFAKAQEQLARRRRLETEAEQESQRAKAQSQQSERLPDTAVECPPSPDDTIFQAKLDAEKAAVPSSSVSDEVLSPVASPIDLTSPISSATLGSSHLGSSLDQFFPSDPSLPTLLSGASSVSADPDGEYSALHNIGHILPEPEDTLTPPALSKQPSNEGDTTTPVTVEIFDAPTATEENHYNGESVPASSPYHAHPLAEDMDDDSDSDEGLTMTRAKPKVKTVMPGPEKRSLERRNTNASVGSTETAKKIYIAE